MRFFSLPTEKFRSQCGLLEKKTFVLEIYSNKEKGCGFELSNIVVAADLFVVVVAAAAEVVPVVVAVGKDM